MGKRNPATKKKKKEDKIGRFPLIRDLEQTRTLFRRRKGDGTKKIQLRTLKRESPKVEKKVPNHLKRILSPGKEAVGVRPKERLGPPGEKPCHRSAMSSVKRSS